MSEADLVYYREALASACEELVQYIAENGIDTSDLRARLLPDAKDIANKHGMTPMLEGLIRAMETK